MFQLWGKEWKQNRMVRDYVYREESDDTRTHKVFRGLDAVCLAFDLSRPIWLESSVAEFQRRRKTRFYADSFVDEIDFDYLEIQILEE